MVRENVKKDEWREKGKRESMKEKITA